MHPVKARTARAASGVDYGSGASARTDVRRARCRVTDSIGRMPSKGANVAFTEEGRRNSRPRRLVRECLDGSDSFVSAQQVFDGLRAGGDKVGLATVYRNLQAMAEAGEVDVLRSVDGEALYRKCGDRHHHHLVCRQCGVTIEVAGPAVERWAAKAAADHGFVDVTHTLELLGICPDCASGLSAQA